MLNRRILPLLLLLLSFGLLACQNRQTIAAAPPTDTPCSTSFPATYTDVPLPLSGFSYPAALAANLATRGKPGLPKPLRSHGWALFDSINAPVGSGNPLPKWRTWPTAYPTYSTSAALTARAGDLATSTSGVSLIRKNVLNARVAAQGTPSFPPVNLSPVPFYPVPEVVCEHYNLPSDCGAAPQKGVTPYSIPQGNMFQNNGDIMLVSVVYNKAAYDYIRDNKLYLASMLDTLKQQGQTIAFPTGSAVLKHMYWPVAGDGYTALPMWRDPSYPADAYVGYEVWKEAVAIRGANAPTAPPQSLSYLYGISQWYDVNDDGPAPAPSSPYPPMNPTFANPTVADLSQFNYQTLSQADLDAMCTNDRAILDQSAYWAYGRRFQAGDSIVQMAVHVVVKEMQNQDISGVYQPGWSFQTFWWADKNPPGPDYGAKRPDSVKPGYLMMVDDGLANPDSANTYKAHFNPYIEPVIHPVQTSCLNCHVRGGWPSQDASYQLATDDPGLLYILRPDDPILQGLMLTDYQWAIPDRAQ